LHLFADIQRISHIEVNLLPRVVINFLLFKEISQFLTVFTLRIQVEAHVVDRRLSRPSELNAVFLHEAPGSGTCIIGAVHQGWHQFGYFNLSEFFRLKSVQSLTGGLLYHH